MEKFTRFAKQHGSRHRHFLLYILIGLSGVTIDFILFALGTMVLGMGILLANFIAISAGIINNFLLNTKYNFKKSDHLWKRFALFYGVGALGLLLSEVLILLFHYGAGLDDLWAKLATLPFVLVFQFLLNKRFSFGDMKQTEKQLRKFFFHWPLYVIALVYTAFSLILVSSIPNNFAVNDVRGGPDEAIHYGFNVDFIRKNHRLPVGGQDDLEAYGACRDNKVGLIPCVYSYNTYPGPNYVASAISAELFGQTKRISPQTASRFTSLASGIIFVIFAYAAAYAITRRRLFSAVIVATLAFIPQVIFTNSYTNMDAHSLAISAVLGFTLVKFMQAPRSRKRQIFLAITLFGLLPVAKYNYFILGLGSLILVVYTFIKHKFTKKELLRFFGYATLSFLVLASFWYIRNLILYNDLLGQSFVVEKMAQYHALGQMYSFNLSSLNLLVHLDFFNILFRSFFYGFGLMNFFLEEYNYKILLAILLGTTSLLGYHLFQPTIKQSENRKLIGAVLLYAFVGLGSLFIIIYNSLHYDFQPQGRYMYPILIPTVLLLAYAIKQDIRNRILPFILFGGTLFVFFEGMDLFIKIYFPL